MGFEIDNPITEY